jgi:zinc protease
VKRNCTAICLVGLALLGAGMSGYAASAKTPAHPVTVALDPAVLHGQLSNGIRYLILQNHEPKGRVSLRFAVSAGSLNETEEQRGLAHFLEHMAFNGSTHFPPGTLVEYLQHLGMGFGADTNAFTSFDRTEYQLELPDTDAATLTKGLTLFADYGDGLLLTQKAVDKEKGIILSEERARDSVEYRASKDESSFLMPHALISQRMPIGLTAVIQNATREQIKTFYDTWYRPENFIVAVVGDIDPKTVEDLLTSILSPVHAHGAKVAMPVLGQIDSGAGLLTHVHADPNAATTTVAIETVSPWTHQPDTAARRLKELPRDLALAMLNQRLGILANKEGTVFTRGSVQLEEQFNFVRTTALEITGEPQHWPALVTTADQTLRQALEYGFEPDELADAVAGVRNSLKEAVNSAPTRASPTLASQLVDSVIDHEIFTTPAVDLALLGPALDRVTPEECRDALRTLWPEHTARYLFLSSNMEIPDSDHALAVAYEAASKSPVTAQQSLAAIAFPYADVGPPSKVVSRRHIDDLDSTLVEFGNGVRLNIKRTDFEAGRIDVSVRVGAGRLTEPLDKPGLALFAQSVFEAGGLGKLSHDDLQRALAGRSVGTEFQVSDDAFTFQGATTPADLPLEMQLLSAYLTDPGYRPEAERQFQKNVEQFYTGLGHDVNGPLQTEVPGLLSSGDRRFGIPPQTAVTQLTLADLRSWLAPQFASGPLEIAIVGDLDVDATIAAVGRTLGALPERTAKPPYLHERQVAMPTQPAERRYAVSTDIPRGVVNLDWTATDQYSDIHRARRLQLLAAILSDRLRVAIREKMGDTYSPGASADLSQTFSDYGFIRAQCIVAPDRAQAVAAAMKEAAAALLKDGVTADELERARAPLMTGVRQSLRNNGYWLAAVLASAQETPEHLDWARDRLTDIQSITLSQLNTLAAQYLSPSHEFEFISVPST